MTLVVRPAAPADLPHLPALQLAAGRAFHGVGMSAVADRPPPAAAEFAPHQRLGRLWVAADGDSPAGFVLARPLGGCAHVEQVSVHPSYAGRRLGARLVDRVEEWAAGQRMPAVTLSTFRSVPWNAPYYLRLGFREVPAAGLTPELRELLAEEAAFGLDPADRVCLSRPVRTP
ncbi:GNAT family N-acetyltransferase [Kitasatospora phosalacinea]|uniref:GCN5 family N-acetyltransferase n=1 Tax=Kitasatospora phosalacinea TaxID=2065 RepID=A0A9W6PKH4_9ACTN|nr:GNAT family N-acetyltransferase [Kitasatospora phosalacinea]GLW57965.1 GCN5 family N-acetyltransferase [Kitasatospora phosalacinea]